jgi:hypothetical protein
MGKLVGMRDGDEEPGTEVDGEDAPHKRHSPKEAFDELQRLADDRVRSLVSAAVAHVGQLQAEVRRLQSRIEELEAKLVGRRRSSEADPADEDSPPP